MTCLAAISSRLSTYMCGWQDLCVIMPAWALASKAQDQRPGIEYDGNLLQGFSFRSSSAARRLLTAEVMQCGYGTFKSESGDHECVLCPGRNTSTAIRGATSVGACRCMHGHYRPIADVLDCEPCAAETYRAYQEADTLPCVPCAPNQTTFGTTGNARCVCKAGMHDTETGCQPCPGGSFCAEWANAPVPCYPGSTSVPGSATMDDCYCAENATRLQRANGAFYCVPLKPGMRPDREGRFIECVPGWRAVYVNGILDSCYLCALGSYANTLLHTEALLIDPLSRFAVCTACPKGFYSGPSRMITGECTACPPLQTTPTTGAHSIEECFCPPPLATNSRGQCEGCTERQYATPHDGCQECPANSRVGAIRGTSILDCLCDKGFQPSSNTSLPMCEPCPAGTYSAIASHDRCSPCSAFGATSTTVGGTSFLSCNKCLPGHVRSFQWWCVRVR